MKKLLFILLATAIFSCSNDDDANVPDTIDLTIFNPELSIVENLDNGVDVLDITEELGNDALYGLEYGGGLVFHVDQTDGTLFVVADYSSIGTTSWGDHFDLTNGALIGDGLENTQQIVEGNLNDNSSVPNGLEFGSDDYAFKIVADLEYQNYDDWFIPSSGSMRAIFENIHSQGLGDIDENLFYWTSTKDGYSPFVMSFNASFGGEAFLGSCFNVNSALIVRKF
jgi:hypothetical protein